METLEKKSKFCYRLVWAIAAIFLTPSVLLRLFKFLLQCLQTPKTKRSVYGIEPKVVSWLKGTRSTKANVGEVGCRTILLANDV